MYSQLNASRKEIRLLHVYPGAWNDNIECHLETVSLYDKPKYPAISYVWGDPNITLCITIDDQSLAITRNLFMGLQRLRRTDKVLVIYADAACINQSDLDERSEQVQLMGEIYSSAVEVLIWLGYGRDTQAPLEQPDIVQWTGDERDDEIIEAYFKRSENRDEERLEQEKTGDVLGMFVFIRICAMDKHWSEIPFFTVENGTLCPKTIWPAVLLAIATLQSNTWWRRIWVVQETVLARGATAMYSNVTIPWNLFTKAARLSRIHKVTCCDKVTSSLSKYDEDATEKSLFATYAATSLQIRERRNEKLSLRDIMRRVHLHEATDIRDEVFGILGLVTDWQGISPIVPDYSLPSKEVFAQAIIGDIHGTGSLISLVGTTMAGLSGVPSWVVEIGPKTVRHYEVAISRLKAFALFSAAGRTAASVKGVGDVLTIDAFEPAQTIFEVGPILFQEGCGARTMADSIEACYRMIEVEKERCSRASAFKTVEETLWRTLTSDSWADPSKDTPRNTGIRRVGNIDVTRLGRNLQTWCQTRATNPDAMGSVYGEDLSDDRFFYEAWFTSGFDRRFFITTGGHMGVGPPEMLPGDCIAILLGGNVPFCLRAVPDAPKGHYTLVGDTYVQGLMDGEGVPDNWKEHVVKINLH